MWLEQTKTEGKAVSETYSSFYQRSVEQPEAFWAEQAGLIHWERLFSRVLNFDRPPFARWFEGGLTNLCYNAVDRHLPLRATQAALIYRSSETGEERDYTYAQLHREVNRCAAMLQHLGVGAGDRVLIYLPMIPQAVFAMLACARIGAIHSVVFGGFAAHSLATRIDDAQPKVLICADAGMRAGRSIPYKPLVDEAIALSTQPPAKVLLVDRGLDPAHAVVPGRDLDYASLAAEVGDTEVPVTWLESTHPSYILYTSGTTGKPKGVQRDVGGYAVALAASMKYIFCGEPGRTMFTTSDIGWVVGHSYIIYAPLIHGMSTVLYEGLPIRPDAAVWWKIVEQTRAQVMFSSPTAIRVLKRQDPEMLTRHDVSSLRHLFLAGEPLDETTAQWISGALKVPVIDNYWQTETGWPILTGLPGVENRPTKLGSPSFPAYGYQVRLMDEETGQEVGEGEKGVLAIVPPLPPGCLATIWGDDERFVGTYFGQFQGRAYSTFDWARRDAEGYYFLLGRTDDVINVAGHRLGTREIEEAISASPLVAEVAVVGIHDALKGQVPVAFVVLKETAAVPEGAQAAALEKTLMAVVDQQLGAIARPARIYLVALLPKTRSGKLLRRSIQALAEGRDPGDLTTLEDPTALEQVREAVVRLRE